MRLDELDKWWWKSRGDQYREEELAKGPLPGVHRVGPLYWMTGNGIGWFRLFGRGLHWNRRAPLFSERNGYVKPLFRVGPWRIRWLPKHRSTQR